MPLSRLAKISIGYTLLVGVWFLARWVFKDQFLPLAAINTVAEYLFIPLPILILLCLIRRERGGLALLVPAGIFAILWGKQYLPGSLPDPGTETPLLRVMTFNVRSANEEPEQLIASIVEESPDLIGFQEISANNLPTLQQSLASDYPYDTFDLYDGRQSDIGVASKFPILSYERVSFPPRDGAVHAQVAWNGVLIHVFVLHFSADNLFEHSLSEIPALERENLADRVVEVTRVEEELAGLDGPVLVLCDCNFTDTTETYRRMSLLLSDSFKQVGWGPGHTLKPFKSLPPIMRIDYIWYNAAFSPLSTHCGDPQSSDHRPLITVLGLRP